MTITYVYEHEEFAKKIFDDLKGRYYKTIKNIWWSSLNKKIETVDILFRFVHHTQLNETYRGHKNTLIFFEPSLVNTMTHEQLHMARMSFMQWGIEQNCLSLGETLEIFRGKQKHE